VSNTHYACSEQFGSIHDPPLQIVESADDGDCLFHALVNYGLAMNFVPFLKSEQAIRFELVDYMIQHFEKYKDSIPIKERHRPANQTDDENRMLQIYEMTQPNVWSTDVGDLFPIVVADCYGLNVMIYNIVESEQSMVQHMHRTEIIHSSRSPVIYLLRIHNNHFNLFLPADVVGPNFSNAAWNNRPAAAASSSNKKKSMRKIKNNVNNLSKALNSMKLSKNAKKSTRKKKKNNNNNNNNNALAAAIAASLQMKNNNSKHDVNNIFNLSKKKKPSKKVAQPGQAMSPPRRSSRIAASKKNNKQKFLNEIQEMYSYRNANQNAYRGDLFNRIQKSALTNKNKDELVGSLFGM
jgi:hypothetical protein